MSAEPIENINQKHEILKIVAVILLILAWVELAIIWVGG